MNERIRIPQIRVIGANGENLGVMSPQEALRHAREAQLDLVEVAPAVSPPVCRIIDYAKYRYDQERKEREVKKKQKGGQLKEMRFRPNIDDHDYQFKLQAIKRFLANRDKVKVTLRFRGREMAHIDRGQRVLDRLAQELADVGVVERPPFQEGRFINVILAPK